ncbi:hypothetical protein Tco_0632854, partial [Tanacetum coccineum]
LVTTLEVTDTFRVSNTMVVTRRVRFDQMENSLYPKTEVKSLILFSCKAGSPLEATSLLSGKGKAVYISHPPLPQRRRE